MKLLVVFVESKMNALPIEWIERIFLRLHGRFGNNFIDKFKNGQKDAQGNDLGVLNAKYVWAEELAGISPERIKNSLLHNYDYAPSCDQFKAQCKTSAPVVTDYKALPKPTVSDEKINELHDKLSAFTSGKRDMKNWAHKIIANPSAYPDISYRYAKEALGVTVND
jgi:hypothetical protein